MKKLIFTLAAMAIGGGLIAQDNRFSAGVELALPVGDMGDVMGFGFGVTLGFEAPVSRNIGLVAQAGYLSFSGKTIDLGPLGSMKTDATGMVTVQVGAKYYFMDNQDGFYLGLLTGVHMQTAKVVEVNPTTLETTEKTELHTNFSLAPMLGYVVNENIDIALRYQMIFGEGVDASGKKKTETLGYLGLRAAYMF